MKFFSPISSVSHVCLVTAATICSTQSVFAQQIIQIVGVDVREIDNGIEIILETASGVSPQFVQTPDANEQILYIDLVDAELKLPDGKDFSVENPATSIESVQVSEEFAGSVSIIITGTEALPTVQLTPSSQGAVLSVTTTSTTAETPTPLPTPEGEQEIEIVVTGEAETEDTYIAPQVTSGTRIEADILEVPQSVQTVTEEVIKDQNINTLSDIFRNVSGVNPGTVSVQDPGSAFVIRGFSAVSGRENILRNGLRDDTLRLISGITNVERVEVLKGPASVLFGQGIVGGTINIITKKPLDEPFYAANFTVGNDNVYRGNIDFTAPLDDDGSLAYRLNVAYEDEESFKDFQEQSFVFADLGLALVRSEQTELYVNVEYQKSTSTAAAPQLPASGTVIDNPFGEVDISENLGEPSISKSEQNVARLSSELEHKFSDNWKLQNQFLIASQETPESLGVNGIGISAGTADCSRRIVTNNPDAVNCFRRVLINNPTTNQVVTINTNVVGEFNTGSIKHQLVMGVEFANQELDDVINITSINDINIFQPVYNPELRTTIPFSDEITKFNEIGLYIQDQITLVDGLILALGGRYDIADTEVVDRLDEDLSNEKTDTNFSPRVGIVYQPAENVSLYASYTESFLPNAGRERIFIPEEFRSVNGDPFEPETGRQYEVGVKTELFNDKVLATLAVFDLERSNVLNLQTLSSFQTGKQKSRGVEVELAGEILPGWKIISSYTYLDTEVLEDERIESGNRLQNAPEHAFNLWTTYSIQKGDLEGLGFGLGFFFESEKEGNLENTFTLPDYFRTDAAIFYEKGNFKAQLNFQNLFDVKYFESARDEFRVNPGAPFTVLGQVSLEF